MKWKCVEDYKMERDGRVVFSKNCIYEETDRIVTNDDTELFFIDDEGSIHGMALEFDMQNFKLLEDE